MTENLLFSSKPAEEINRAIQAVDEKLFLFCNYNPLPLTGNTRLDVHNAILNLFRATVDSVPLWSQLRKCWGWRSKKDTSFDFSPYLSADVLQVLQDADSKQDHLRAYLAHNNHEHTSTGHKAHILAFRDWETLATGEQGLNTAEGAAFALESLLTLGDQLENALRNMVTTMAESADRAYIAQAITDQVIYWYTENTRQQMFLSFVDRGVSRCNYKTSRNALIKDYLRRADVELTDPKESTKKFFVQAKVDLADEIIPLVDSLLPQVLLDRFVRELM